MHIFNHLSVLTALLLSVSVAAQSPIPQPKISAQTPEQDHPVRIVLSPPQRDPILKLTIAPEKRGDLSYCNARIKNALDYVAESCWPVLQAYQDLIRFKAAGQTAISKHQENAADADLSRDHALALAEQLHRLNADARWPMQDYLVQSSYSTLIAMFRAFGDHEAALAQFDSYIALQSRSLMDNPIPLRGYIYKDKTAYLLDLGRRDEALANFRAAVALADHEPVDLIANVEHAELIAYDAITAKNEDRALDAIAFFRQKTLRHSRHHDPVYFPLQLLRLYVLVTRKDYDGVLAELQSFDRNICRDDAPQSYFPQVISPMHGDPRIAAQLVALGCSADYIAKAPKGPPVLRGITSLPPQ